MKKEDTSKSEENYEKNENFPRGENFASRMWGVGAESVYKKFLWIFCSFEVISHLGSDIKKIKNFFLAFSTKNFFFALKHGWDARENIRLTILISLMVAIDRTKRFIRTTAGPSKDFGYILILVKV
jgi:hypothetical protein